MNILFRNETSDDDRFVRQLVIDFAAEDLGAAEWPEPVRDHLLDMQYRIRRQNIQSNPSEISGRIILVDGEPGGWLVLSDSTEEVHVVDIILHVAHRGKGVGTEVLRQVLTESERAGKAARLTVRKNNPAVHLYERLGFQKTDGDEVQHFMKWAPVTGSGKR